MSQPVAERPYICLDLQKYCALLIGIIWPFVKDSFNTSLAYIFHTVVLNSTKVIKTMKPTSTSGFTLKIACYAQTQYAMCQNFKLFKFEKAQKQQPHLQGLPRGHSI